MKRIIPGLVLLLSALFTACDQEPLFWIIAHEYPPIEPIIEGSPSQIAAVTYADSSKALYVSNGDIWEWNVSASPHPNWHKMGNPPGGKIKTVAAAGEYLFSLERDTGIIRKFNGSVWSDVGGIVGTPEQIYGAGDYLFAGSRIGYPGASYGYSILAMDASSSSMTSIQSGTGLLQGAATDGATYYLGTMGGGIFATSDPTSSSGSVVSGTETYSIVGLIAHGTEIVAVTTRSQVVYLDGASFTEFASFNGTQFSGAMASWEDGDGNRLLLLGLKNSNGSFGFGYRELCWRDGGTFIEKKDLYTPGGEGEFSSVEQDLQYISAIGNHAVNALYVLPHDSPAIKADNIGRPIVLASTQNNGFWSYRVRGNRAQWNGEDNSN